VKLEQMKAVLALSIAAGFLALCAGNSYALDKSVPAIHGDVSRNLLGDGTGVIIGIIDSGIDVIHPALAGNDSLGNPRLVAQQNFVTYEPGNTGDDVFGHGTWVSSIALSKDPIYRGLAPDARFVNSRVLDNNDSFSSDQVVNNGIAFAISNGASIINLSLNYGSPGTNGNNGIELMTDWAAQNLGISFTISAGNIPVQVLPDGTIVITGTQPVRSPAGAYNAMTVGRTDGTYARVRINSAVATTSDGRMKPDVVAPGTAMTLANDDWETGPQWENTTIDNGQTITLNGTSLSAPHVAGMMAQQIEFGRANNLSTNPLVIKATLMNSAVHVLERDGSPWHPRTSSVVAGVLQVTSPLDTDSGAGQIDGAKLLAQYSAGQQAPGNVGAIGWDLHTINGVSSLNYDFATPLAGGSLLTATLDWFRHVNRTDNGDGILNGLDTFSVAEALDNLDLTLLYNGNPVAKSMSLIDNVEHLSFFLPGDGAYSLQVDRLDVAGSGNDELYALAWSVAAVPEPASWLLAVCGLAACSAVWRRQTFRRNDPSIN
jgi:hypothetical protein